MDAKTFAETHGRELVRQVVGKADTTMEYFSQIAHGHRRASVDLAHRLVAASEEVIAAPDARLDLLSLLRPRGKVT
jgi:hypothetical protein